jgi:hypothetical protein
VRALVAEGVLTVATHGGKYRVSHAQGGAGAPGASSDGVAEAAEGSGGSPA